MTVPVPQAPAAVPLLGHALPLMRSPLSFLTSLHRFGNVVEIMLGTRRAYVACTPELTRQVLLDDRTFDKGDCSTNESARSSATVSAHARTPSTADNGEWCNRLSTRAGCQTTRERWPSTSPTSSAAGTKDKLSVDRGTARRAPQLSDRQLRGVRPESQRVDHPRGR